MSVTAAEWAEWDPNELTKAAVRDAADPAELLTKRLAFGTAGLRGPMVRCCPVGCR